MPPTIGVVCGVSHPVRVDIIREIIGDRATVKQIGVPMPLSSSEQARFAAELEDVTCVIVRGGAFPRDLLERLPELRHIAAHAAGFDRIDLQAATDLGILVTNAPGANAYSVAELALALAVSLARDIVPIATAVKAGQWDEVRETSGSELRGRRLGILGTGNVGSKVAALALAFGMEVVAYDPLFTPEQHLELGITWLPFAEVISSADFLTVHVPLDDNTRQLIDANVFATMKPGAYFLNLGRGGLVDEEALAAALTSGHLAGAALDVRRHEPPLSPDPLCEIPNIVLTPHMGGSTSQALERIAATCANQVIAFINGDPVPHHVNQI